VTITANQPYFLPYFPYWQLIHAGDVFLVSDDYAFMTQSWIARNRIWDHGKPIYFRVEVQKASCHRLIGEHRILPPDRRGMLRTLEMAYHKTPFFADGMDLASRILSFPSLELVPFLTASMREVCGYLGIDTPLRYSSSIEGNALLKREERVYHFCHRLGADHYVNAIGGRVLYKADAFRRQGIHLQFLQTTAQLTHPQLSVIDAIMYHSREELHEKLDHYRLIDE
jgi:hypothetical protein